MTGDALEHRRIECQIGDHMVTELAQFSFEEPIYQINETSQTPDVADRPSGASVVRTYLPEYTIEESKAPRITVVTYGFAQTRAGRGYMQETFMIDVVVHQTLAGSPTDRSKTKDERVQMWRDQITQHGDHVTKISEQVRMFFEKDAPKYAKIEGCEGCDCARWMSVTGTPIYEPVQVNEKQLVVSIQRHNWLTVRQLCRC